MLLDETPLFDPSLLLELDWSSSKVSFSPPVSPSEPGDGLALRPLHPADLDRGTSEVMFPLRPLSTDLHLCNTSAFVSVSRRRTVQSAVAAHGGRRRHERAVPRYRGLFRGLLADSLIITGCHFFTFFPCKFVKRLNATVSHCGALWVILCSTLIANFEHMKKTGDYYVIVVEDTNVGQIVATATLIIEHKFIHACAKVQHTHHFYHTCVLLLRRCTPTH